MSSDASFAHAGREQGSFPEYPVTSAGHIKGAIDAGEVAQEQHRQQEENAEEALESHEVIELQAFIERKEWIEEKIKLLESLPPIDAFAGTDNLLVCQENGALATRAQLEEWMAEHDRIEKETEIFDRGDLMKLKKLTKAATQRNLSPQDTDLIELTLTTLYALDKLLHLLRDRSGLLELLNLRLGWEEHRVNAFRSQEEILTDLRLFLSDRARWSQEIYGAGLFSSSSNDLVSSLNDIKFSVGSELMSRSARFKLAEELSRDAAQFSSRVTALRHGHVAASGKILDKLIDNSRDPVPDSMLDEQDRLEEKCANDLEAIGKFTMLVVMQWKKADEIYVETKKDSANARNLLEEISRAMNNQPIRRLESNFSGRIDMLRKRLQSRTDPTSLASTFPLPSHQLFPEQSTCNSDIAKCLSSELKSAHQMVTEAGRLIKIYRARCDAVEEAGRIVKEISEISTCLAQINDRLENGFIAYDGDGSPPDLNNLTCVDPLHFSAYLAMLPSMMEQIAATQQTVSETTRRARLSVLQLEKTQGDDAVKSELLEGVDELQKNASATDQIKDSVVRKVSTLREVRRVWSVMDGITRSLNAVSEELKESLLMNRWKQETGRDAGPLTPESSQAALPTILADSTDVDSRLTGLRNQLVSDVNDSISRCEENLPTILRDHIRIRQRKAQILLQDLQKMSNLLSAVRRQASAMECIREEAHTLESRIEEIKTAYDQCFQDAVSFSDNDIAEQAPNFTDEEITAREETLGQQVVSLRNDVEQFVNGLPTRIPFISRRSVNFSSAQTNHAAVYDAEEPVFECHESAEAKALLPFDPASVDRVVRNDSNAYSLLLSGEMKSLLYKQSLSSFFKSARMVSSQLADLSKDINAVDELLTEAEDSFSHLHATTGNIDVSDNFVDSITSLRATLEDAANLDTKRVTSTVTDIRRLMNGMRDMPGLQDDVNHFNIFTSRSSKLDELDLRWHRVHARLDTLRGDVNNAHQNEISRLQRQAELAEAQRTADRLKKEQEEAELLRKEQEEARLLRKQQEDSERLIREREEADRLKKVQDEANYLRKQLEESERRKREQEEIVTWSKEEDSPRARLSKSSASTVKNVSGAEDDIFAADYQTVSSMDEDKKALLDRTRDLRKRLKSIGLENLAYPPESSRRVTSAAPLPTTSEAGIICERFEVIKVEVNDLPLSVDHLAVDIELRSLREDMELSHRLASRIKQLGKLSQHVTLCDIAFSEFLDHIDSYPALPDIEGQPKLSPALRVSPEDRLQERMAHTKGIFGDMNEHFRPIAEDLRAISEHNRLRQTWDELMDMGLEKLNGRPSRPTSAALSSGRNSSASISSSHAQDSKRKGFSKLSAGNGKAGFLVPSTQRRAVSSTSISSKAREDAPSRMSLTISRSHTPRSVSGPMSPPTTHSSLYSSTFASRQRTTSLSSTTSSVMSGGGKTRPGPSGMGRRMSTVQADVARARSPSVSTSSRGTWPRAPRQSFSSVPRATTPDRSTKRKQKYVADPKNKLDIAVGDVVNNLPVDINVEVVADTWKDKSGKYWIGGSEPKLCFCRILRSQTVMVRVGGGWSELSKFIKDHFADLFRLIPESPPRTGTKEEKWINASTLHTANVDERTGGHQSPDSVVKHLPSFALSTPDGSFSQTMPSTPSIGAPLTPLQFMRKAERDPAELSLSSLALSTATGISSGFSTPSKSQHSRSKASVPGTPSKHTVWRP